MVQSTDTGSRSAGTNGGGASEPPADVVERVAARVYELMRDDLRLLRERSGSGLAGWS